MSTVSVNQSLLNWALKRSNLLVSDLESKFPKLQEWIDGSKLPTLRQLETFARVTMTPFGYFFLSDPPEESMPIPHFRTLKDETTQGPSPNLLDTIRIMQRRQAWMREYLIDDDYDPLAFVGSINNGVPNKEVAERMRALLGFGENWASKQSTWENALRSLREAMEFSGILVVVNSIIENNTHRKLDVGEFRGFVLVDEYAPLVFVNGSDSKAAQMFTLAHELAHIFWGSSAAFDLRQLQPAEDAIEQACNLIAAEFLVAESVLRANWHIFKSSTDPFQAIARYFKVSVLVAARRALDLELISQDKFFEYYQQYQDAEFRTRSQSDGGGSFYPTQNLRVGKRFALTVARAVSENRLLYSEAYRLTSLYGVTFDKYISTIVGGEPYA